MKMVSDNIRGAAFMCASMAGFVLNDTFMKLAAADLSLFQAIFLRGLFATFFIGGMAWRKKAVFCAVPKADRKVLAVRLVGEIGGTFCFLTALFNMPIANATAILQVLPLAVTLAAAIFLRKAVGWRRYLAIAIGFVGVVIVIRPGSEGFNHYSFWALAAVAFIVLRDLVTVKLSAQVPSLFVALSTAAGITLAAAILSPTMEWMPVEGGQVAMLAIAAVFLNFGYLFSVMTMRVGDISFISPFRYTTLIWALVIGVVVFGDPLDQWTILGSSIIIAMGIFTFYRERRAQKLSRAETA